MMEENKLLDFTNFDNTFELNPLEELWNLKWNRGHNKQELDNDLKTQKPYIYANK